MTVNRYSYLTIVRDNKNNKNKPYISRFPTIDPKDLQSNDDTFVKLQYGQRIDNLAYQYLGDGRYWWVICLINGLKTPYDKSLVVGKLLRIPVSINKIIQVLQKKSNDISN